MENIFDFVNRMIKKYQVTKIPYSQVVFNQLIGEGTESKVYQGRFKNHKVALKFIHEYDRKCLESEIAILQNISHDSIPKFFGIIIENDIIVMVLELIEGRTLDEFEYKYMKEETKSIIIKQLSNVIEFIHTKGLIHRDIKPENIIICDNYKIFLIDYGISKILNKEENYSTRTKGTTYYLAPENLDAIDYTPEEDIVSTITNKVDVWSFGCLVSYLFSSTLPWTNVCNNDEESILAELAFKHEFPIPDNITNMRIRDIISRCTNVEPSERSSMSDIRKLIDNLKS